MAIGYIKDKDTGSPDVFNFGVNLKTIDGYTPKNKKCFCYPYNAIILTNNSGARVTYKPELFNKLSEENNTVTVYYNCIVSANPSLFCYMGNYLGLGMDFSRTVSFNNFPPIPYTYDLYSNWLALNKNTLTMQYIQQGLNLSTEAATGNVAGLVNGSLSLANMEAKQADMKNKPDSMNGVPQGNDLLYSGAAGIFINQETCRKEYIKNIDDFFSRYGYLVNEVKKPLLKTRINFNYIETKGCIILGDIPAEDRLKLQGLFDSGLTIWHNIATFGDIQVSNNSIFD